MNEQEVDCPPGRPTHHGFEPTTLWAPGSDNPTPELRLDMDAVSRRTPCIWTGGGNLLHLTTKSVRVTI